ncbi:MAG TPA: hypothetical protein VMZ29_13000 [Candidatus Bathyarchaeia archaeon]|nr:hypothetical protein [Candidatus Bathyarchaeia archaeon]
MSYKYLISKIAADKEGNKLGKVIRIDKLPRKTDKLIIPYLMILVSKRFKKDILVPIEADKALEAKGSYVLLNISKEDFDKEAKRIRDTKEEREKYTGTLNTETSRRAGAGNLAIDYTNLSGKSKERRR